MNIEQGIKNIIAESHYMTPDMIKFLLIENLTLKTILHEKGLMTLEEFNAQRAKAAEILDERFEAYLKQHLKKMVAKNDDEG